MTNLPPKLFPTCECCIKSKGTHCSMYCYVKNIIYVFNRRLSRCCARIIFQRDWRAPLKVNNDG